MTWPTRLADASDAQELVRLRRLMFVAMELPVDDEQWEQRCVEFFREGLGDKDLVAVVVDDPQGQGLAASGVVEIQHRIPSPVNPAGLRAYVSSMSTDPLWRRRGMARAVMNHVLDLLRERGVPEVTLHATESGRPLYASFGFYRRDREMVRPLW
jgi:GNAT superfamily N-acetyltransferase